MADTKLRNFARMHTMRNLYPREQNVRQTKRQKKNVNVHVELGRKGDSPTQKDPVKPLNGIIKTKQRSRNAMPNQGESKRDKILGDILQYQIQANRQDPNSSSQTKNSAVPPVLYQD